MLERFTSLQAYTPRHLAEKILTSRSALEGERKQVTVLFCDLANSTAMAARCGPDNMHTLLGGVSNVDIDGNNAFQIKVIGVVISTFETLPDLEAPAGDRSLSGTERRCVLWPSGLAPHRVLGVVLHLTGH